MGKGEIKITKRSDALANLGQCSKFFFGRQKYEIWMIIYYTSIMYVQAKMVLGLSSATKAEELDSEDIHKKFISKLALVISRIINQN